MASAIAAGLLLLAAFPPVGLWWTAPAGVALLAVATHRRGLLAGAGLGLLTGLAFLGPLLSWTGLHVGAVWLLLPVAEAAYVALLGAAAAGTSAVVDRWRWSWPLVTGALWVASEALRDRTPFGGFPWGRLAFSQGDSPLLRLAALGGAPLVTFGVAAIGGLLAVAAAPLLSGSGPPARLGVRAAAFSLAAVVIAVLVPLAVPTATATGRTVTVAIVQGNVPRLGLDFNAQRRAVLDNHVDATLALAQRVSAGRAARPDLVVWPENASDIDPLANVDARARIDAAAVAIGAPILVGGLLEGPGNRIRNVGLVWRPGTGPGATYVKRHPVPFAEYMPLRPIARLLTDKVDLVQSDFVAGPVPGVLAVGPATVGDVICFEVAYDNVVRDTVTGGAQLLVVQTNNATFNAAEAHQQLAMVRLRAVEHGRPALMASTVGVSAFVRPDGGVLDATGFNQPAVIVRELRLSSARTMATAVGVAPELALVAVAIAALVAAIVLGRARGARRAGPTDVRRVDR
ncbi:MAG: apolipoprotein N-acyltransferase [Micromonosporaceae bacterium]